MDDRDELLNLLINHLYSLERAVVSITHLLIERGHLDRQETADYLRRVEQGGRTAAAELGLGDHVDRGDLIRIADDIEELGSSSQETKKHG
jgi:hypothetical protein